MLKIADILKEGLKKINQQHLEEEEGGSLRGGSAGHVDEEGKTSGNCQRLAHLRYLGYNIQQHPMSTLIMFSGGLGSEEIQCKSLDAMGYSYLREEEIPICWTTKAGVKVTGRPDIVLVDENKTPIHGIELKMASTVWTSKSVRFDKEPKLNHLIQAAHYSWQLDIPFSLVYVQYVKFSVPRGAKWVPSSPFLDKEGLVQWKDKWAQYVQPFIYGYELFFDKKGRLWYENAAGESNETIITLDGIKRFYETTHEKKLHPRPQGIKADGKKAGYSPCSYCPLQETCDMVEERGLTYEDWLMLIESREETTIKLPTDMGSEGKVSTNNKGGKHGT